MTFLRDTAPHSAAIFQGCECVKLDETGTSATVMHSWNQEQSEKVLRLFSASNQSGDPIVIAIEVVAEMAPLA